MLFFIQALLIEYILLSLRKFNYVNLQIVAIRDCSDRATVHIYERKEKRVARATRPLQMEKERRAVNETSGAIFFGTVYFGGSGL